MVNEKQLEKQVIKYLNSVKVPHFKYNANSQRFGIADIIACVNGRFVAIELKSPNGKGKATELQKANLEAIEKEGGIGIITNSLEEIKDLIYILRNDIKQCYECENFTGGNANWCSRLHRHYKSNGSRVVCEKFEKRRNCDGT